MLVRTGAALLGLASLASGATLVSDEITRIEVLAALFPNARLTEIPGKRIDNAVRLGSVEFPDALKDERVYDVTGPVAGKAEECATFSDVDVPDPLKRHRTLRFELFSLKPRSVDYVAVLQYQFAETQPLPCPSIAEIVTVSGKRRIAEFFPELTHHRIGWQTITFADNLVVESDWGGGGAQYSELSIFDLASNKLSPLVSLRSRGVDNDGDQWVSVLDVPRTAAKPGRQFCFSKTTYVAEGKPLRPPKVSHPCYPPGTANQ